jgi:hypothetical protein
MSQVLQPATLDLQHAFPQQILKVKEQVLPAKAEVIQHFLNGIAKS